VRADVRMTLTRRDRPRESDQCARLSAHLGHAITPGLTLPSHHACYGKESEKVFREGGPMSTRWQLMVLGTLLVILSTWPSIAQVTTPPITGVAPGNQRPGPQGSPESSGAPTLPNVNPPKVTPPGEPSSPSMGGTAGSEGGRAGSEMGAGARSSSSSRSGGGTGMGSAGGR
jgi:hypothetical protein